MCDHVCFRSACVRRLLCGNRRYSVGNMNSRGNDEGGYYTRSLFAKDGRATDRLVNTEVL